MNNLDSTMHYKTKKKLNIIRAYIKKRYKHWHEAYPNLIGAYPGEKLKGGNATGKYSIIFLVSKKQRNPEKALPKHFEVSIPGKGKTKIPTDVIRSKPYKLRGANLSDKIRRQDTGEFGTTGAFLISGSDIYACTSAHVLIEDVISANQTHFFRARSQQTFPDVAVFDGVGGRFDAYRQEGFFDGIDAAIARMDDPGAVGNTIPGFGKPSGVKSIQAGEEGLALTMAGFVSGNRSGIVTKIGLTIPTPISGVFLHDVVETNIFSAKGDSGSSIFTANRRIAGILLGGTTTTSLLVPLDKILAKFQCSLLL